MDYTLYKDKHGTVHAVSPIQVPHADWTALTEQEVHAHLNPPPALEPVPQTISRAQGRLVLYRKGLWPKVQEYFAGITDPAEQFEADTVLNHTNDWQRASPSLGRVAQALNLGVSELDDLFREAAKIMP